MNENQKKTTDEFRQGWDNIFGKKSDVKVKLHNKGSGGLLVITGSEQDAVLARAKEEKAKLDYMRSPFISGPYQDQDQWRCEVTYYGLD